MFKLGAGVLVMGYLGFAHRVLHFGGRTVALFQRQSNVGECVLTAPRASVHEPGVVDGPELVGGNEFFETFQSGNLLVVALLDGRAAGGGVFSAEPVVRRPPAIRAFHADAVPYFRAVRTFRKSRNSIHRGVLPVQTSNDAMVFVTNIVRRHAIAAVRPDECRRVRAKHQDLRTETLRRNASVFLAPLVPFLPLVATHPAEHDRNDLLDRTSVA